MHDTPGNFAIWHFRNRAYARLDVTGFLLGPYDVVVTLYQTKLLHEVDLFIIGLSFCLRVNFGMYICQPETSYHNSDSD